MKLALAISPCPNDTFAFHGLLTRAIDVVLDSGERVELEIELHDIEELNRGLLAGRWQVAKASFAAALELGARARVLRVGSALGFGVGPLLLAPPNAREDGARDAAKISRSARVLAPGAHTTANLLLRLFHPGVANVEHVVFSEILPKLARREADFGVCIHEGRFTYERYGLTLVEDLGATWEASARSPLPLGGIVARDTLTDDVLRALERAIRASLDLASREPAAALRTMREHAREGDDAAAWKHVELYVNEWTRDLGATGTRALAELASRARAAGLSREHGALRVFSV